MATLRQIPRAARENAKARIRQLLSESKPCYEIATIVNAEFAEFNLATTANSVYLHAQRAGLEASGPSLPRPKKLSHDSTEAPDLNDLFEGYQAVQPITIDADEEGARSIFLSDLHMPFTDWPALKATEAFMKSWQPTLICYVGDVLDCYDISRFDKNPSRKFRINDERRLAMDMLDRHHRICPDAQQVWLDGNHEERLVRYLWSRAPEIADLVDEDSGAPMLGIPTLLGLNKRHVQYTSYAGHIDYLGFLVTHGNLLSKHSSYTAKQMSERLRSSGLSGHSHRLGMYNWTGLKGPQAWYENGCLCRLDPDYMHNPNWQQGFHIGIVVDQKVHILPGIFFSGVLYIEGKVYRQKTSSR
jgi:hypothetical protein